MKPKRIDAATPVTLAFLSRWFDWRAALVVVRPETLIRWAPREFSTSMAVEVATGAAADSTGTARTDSTDGAREPALGSRANRERAAAEARSSGFAAHRRLIHYNVTAHPSAQWTRQQLREAVGYESRYEYLIHDRDSIFSADLDEAIQRLGLRVLKSPPRSPTANAICERVIGTIRRECLDWLIPLSEAHLRRVLKSWVAYYNRGRPHSALGPGVPDPPTNPIMPLSTSRHRLDDFHSVYVKAILGGLHHEYSLAPM